MDSPKTMIEFMEIYRTEEDCRKALLQHRWPEGFECPRCGHNQAYTLKKRPLFECTACGHQASVTAGTILEGTRTDLRKWFLAIYLLATTKKPISSAELVRQLGIAPFTAWTMRHKIARAMTRRKGELMLLGMVEMDESYVGGARKGVRGRGAEGKTPVVVIARQNESGGCSLAHMHVLENTSGLSLGEAARGSIAPGSTVVTDGLPSYRRLGSLGYEHEPLVTGGVENAAELLPWVHIIISNFKRWILDVFHGVSAGHFQSYLDEFCYRLNRRRQRTDLFRRVLNRCVRFTEPVTYAQLIAS
ncbi:MAG TPA: IS1595 family transposase [Gammaproteobacteria bacterium]|nr:IS1595 family transposase [Gammaproteobacteria bacterium]